MRKICQSCGMEMVKKQDFGTNANGEINEEYCTYCFQNGAFTKEYTMEEMIENNLNYLDEFYKASAVKFNEQQAREEMLRYFPTLKRWKI